MRLRTALLAPMAGLMLLAMPSAAQVSKIVISAGTPEDQALQTITNEPDAQKRIALYQGFLSQFSSNRAAVAYGNWQLSQLYLAAGNTEQALACGDKAVAAMPGELDLLSSQVTVAQQMKDNARIVDYAVRGGTAFEGIGKQPKPPEMSDQDFAAGNDQLREEARSNHEYLEGAAYSAIAAETDGKKRMSYIERFNTAFPGSRYQDQVTQYAMISLQQMNDRAGLVAFGERALAANPNNATTLLLLAETLAEDVKTRPKALEYARKAVAQTKGDGASGDPQKALLAASAHSVLGFVLVMQGGYDAAIPELKAAAGPLKDQDAAESRVVYCLGLSYAKLRRYTEARVYLTQASSIPGPFQKYAREMLAQVNALRAKGQ
jgi:tetratricopeptide (TPR) repeat protein